MTSHELAALLLSAPDLPVVVQVNGHTHQSDVHAHSHGMLQVAIMHRVRGECVVLGNDLQDIEPSPIGMSSTARSINR